MTVDGAGPSSGPSIAGPLFLTYCPTVEVHNVMGSEDLARAGLDSPGGVNVVSGAPTATNETECGGQQTALDCRMLTKPVWE